MREDTRKRGRAGAEQQRRQLASIAEQQQRSRGTERRRVECARHFTLLVVVVAVQMELGGREVEPIRGAKWNLCRSMGDFVYCPFAAC